MFRLGQKCLLGTLPNARVLRMSSAHSIMSLRSTHEQRTASDHREAGIYEAVLTKIEQPTKDVRLLRLEPRLDPNRRNLAVNVDIGERDCEYLISINSSCQANGSTYLSPKCGKPVALRLLPHQRLYGKNIT